MKKGQNYIVIANPKFISRPLMEKESLECWQDLKKRYRDVYVIRGEIILKRDASTSQSGEGEEG